MPSHVGISRAYTRVIIGVLVLITLQLSLRGFKGIHGIVGDKSSLGSTLLRGALSNSAADKGFERASSFLQQGRNIAAFDSLADDYNRANATFVSLVRNSELDAILGSIRSLEDRFNRFYHYDWVFLNDEPFEEDFKKAVSNMVSGSTKFGLVPEEHWGYPNWIDLDFAKWTRDDMVKANAIYGGSESYRHMCRYESGFFYRHPLMMDYRYYWRIEPDTRYHCDVGYDVFKYMNTNNISYGFTISLLEFPITVQTLGNTTSSFLQENPQFKHPNSLSSFVLDDNGNYNLCHFWSNFEIADMNFWRGEAYSKYFDYLDRSGGFFYERWGDAPVHSLAASLFLDKKELHFFEDIGYTHSPYMHCPANCTERSLKCSCKWKESFDWDSYSCMTEYHIAQGLEIPEGVDIQGVTDRKIGWRESASGLSYKKTPDDKTRYRKDMEEKVVETQERTKK